MILLEVSGMLQFKCRDFSSCLPSSVFLSSCWSAPCTSSFLLLLLAGSGVRSPARRLTLLLSRPPTEHYRGGDVPATIPYSQAHEGHAAGAYSSSERGSSSTSGEGARGSGVMFDFILP